MYPNRVNNDERKKINGFLRGMEDLLRELELVHSDTMWTLSLIMNFRHYSIHDRYRDTMDEVMRGMSTIFKQNKFHIQTTDCT
ncbi:hypothetical protein PSPO01_12822 [Paraphaeosphaeria sporulosa]